jgi:hypothetical protein
LQELSVFLVFRLDRFEVTAGKLNELSPEIATEILRRSWATVHDTDDSLAISRHVVTATVYSQILGPTYEQVLGKFIKPPQGLGASSQAGAVFYVGDKKTEASLALDRITGQKQGLLVRLSVAFGGKQLRIDDVVNQASSYLDKYLKTLGLVLEQ